MSDVLLYYYLFAVTTGIVSMYELINPVLNELKLLEPNNPIVQSMKMSKLTFFLVTVIGAPVFFLSCIIPSFGERFRTAFRNAISD